MPDEEKNVVRTELFVWHVKEGATQQAIVKAIEHRTNILFRQQTISQALLKGTLGYDLGRRVAQARGYAGFEAMLERRQRDGSVPKLMGELKEWIATKQASGEEPEGEELSGAPPGLRAAVERELLPAETLPLVEALAHMPYVDAEVATPAQWVARARRLLETMRADEPGEGGVEAFDEHDLDKTKEKAPQPGPRPFSVPKFRTQHEVPRAEIGEHMDQMYAQGVPDSSGARVKRVVGLPGPGPQAPPKK